AVFLQPAIHRASAESKGPGRLADVSVMARQSALYQVTLHFIEAHVLEPNGAVRGTGSEAKVSGTDKLPLREQHSALDRVIEFPNISRPRMVKEELRRTRIEARNAFAIALRVTTE